MYSKNRTKGTQSALRSATARLATAGLLVLCGSLLQNTMALAQNAPAGAWISHDHPQRPADVVLEGDRLAGGYAFAPAVQDVGREAELYLVARVGQRWYMHDGGGWRPWNDGRTGSLRPMLRKTLTSQEVLPMLSGEALPAGDYEVHAGYRVTGGELVRAPGPFRFRVLSASSEQLVPFRSPDAMEAWLESAMTKGAMQPRADMFVTAVDAVSGESGRSSTTNLQVDGVDEADTVKLDEGLLFMLRSCKAGACLDSHQLQPATASSIALGSLPLDAEVAPEGMYLTTAADGSRSLVTLSGRNRFWPWFSIWGWSEGRTTLGFFDASQPAGIRPQQTLELDGALVASRRVGDALYVVTRYAPNPPAFYPMPVLEKEQEANQAVLQDTKLPELLPRVRNAQRESRPLVAAENCYLPASAVDGGSNPTIITVSAVSLTTREVENSLCFTGDSEALYMTPNALYLATTSWDYEVVAGDALVYDPEHRTTIHKFALGGGDIVYRGSGEVEGHLGWEDGKKSFRMGENGDYLNVVSSIGDSWNGESSTLLSVLTEGAGGLQTVATVPGIGKPGEQLYASRFFGDRAYLVTFRLTDPLYVIDLADQRNPRIVGELEIPGYSDYLHPVSESLLLGIGKEAIADAAGGDARGAWAQGVKLALFDVSNPATPRELDSVVLGKRGSDTDVVWDHHAFTWLPPAGSEPARIAIPVRLHDRTPEWRGWDAGDPSAWYDYSHTALYTFEVSAAGITRAGRLIGQEAGAPVRDSDTRIGSTDPVVGILPAPTRLIAPIGAWYSDRSVLADDAVYYLHEGEVLGAFWGEDRNFAR